MNRQCREIPLWLAGALVMVLGLIGCSGGPKPAFPVSGKVVDAEGKAARGAMIVFHPTPEETDPTKPVARVDERGEFKLTTYAEGDGAPAGDYAVTIIWPTPRKSPFEQEGPDQLNGDYANARSPKIRFTVQKTQENRVPEIQLP